MILIKINIDIVTIINSGFGGNNYKFVSISISITGMNFYEYHQILDL